MLNAAHRLHSLSTVSQFIGTHNQDDHIDALRCLIDRERSYVSNNYVANASIDLSPPITAVQRSTLFHWLVQMSDFAGYSTFIAEVALSIIDRSNVILANKKIRIDQRLLFSTALMIASKLNEHTVMGSGCIQQLMRNSFTVNQIEEAEFKLLKLLDWKLNPPTFKSYFEEFCCLLNLDETSKGIIWISFWNDAKTILSSSDFIGETRFNLAVALFFRSLEINQLSLSNLLPLSKIHFFEMLLHNQLNIQPRGFVINEINARLKSYSSVDSLDQVTLS